MQDYQVVGAVAIFTVPSPTGPSRQYMYKGAWVPGDVPQAEIDHNLSVGLIAPVDDPYNTPVDGNGNDTPLGTPATAADNGQASAETPDAAKADEAEAKREAARAKLPADGSAPAGNLGQDVWAEYAVVNGYDRPTVEASSRDEIKSLFKN